MSLKKSEFERLRRTVREAWPGLGSERLNDVTQEALSRALANESHLRDDFEGLQQAVPDIVRSLRAESRTNSRRGFDLPRQEERNAARAEKEPSQLEPRQRRRSPRERPPPKGVTRVWSSGVAPEVIAATVGDPADAPTRAAAVVLVREWLLPAFRGQSLAPEDLQRIRATFSKIRGHEPEQIWAAVLADEIEHAARQKRAAQLVGARPPVDKPAVDVLTIKRKKGAPNSVPSGNTPVQTRIAEHRGKHVVFELFREREGGEETLGRLEATVRNADRSGASRYDCAAPAELVVLHAIARLSDIPFVETLPDYAMDPELIQVLIERMGFAGGGGASGKLKKRRIIELLTKPRELAGELERSFARLIKRLPDEKAHEIQERSSAIVARLRGAANAG